MIGKLRAVVLDAPDHAGLAAFYSSLTGWTQSYADEEWINLDTPDGYRISFQRAPNLKPARWPDPEYPQQFHLDLRVPDLDEATAAAEKLGATRLGGGETWHTLADLAAHPFDLCLNADDPAYSVFAVTIDCADPATLARFYAELMGMEVRYDGEEGSLIGADGQGQIMFQKVPVYNPPQWPDPEHPQQFHLDLTVTDIEAAEAATLALGATKLPGGGEDFRVYADLEGHPFCLCW